MVTPPLSRRSDIELSKVYAIRYSNGWQHTASDGSAAEARGRGLPVIEFVPRDAYMQAEVERDRYRVLLAEFESHRIDSSLDWMNDWTRRVYEALDA